MEEYMFFTFTAVAWNEVDNKREEIKGVTAAKNWQEAFNNIYEYYADDLFSLDIQSTDMDSVYELEVKEVKN